MTNQQIVSDFKSKLDKVFKTYFISELVASAIVIAIGVVALLLVLRTDNQRALMITILCIFIAVFVTSFINIRLFFGSVSGMNRIVNFRTRYDFVSKNLDDSKKQLEKGKITIDDYNIAKTIFDDEMNALFNEIKNINIKNDRS